MIDWREHNEKLLATVHPVLASRVRCLLDALLAQQIPCYVVYGLRTFDEQDQLYAKGRSVAGARVTNARGGWSMHNFGLAVDLVPDDTFKAGLQLDWNPQHPAWKTMLALAPQYHLNEGAAWRSFPDFPHFYPAELDPSPNDTMRSLYAKGGLDEVFTWFDSIISVRERAAAQTATTTSGA